MFPFTFFYYIINNEIFFYLSFIQVEYPGTTA